jgi:hypothetical protein
MFSFSMHYQPTYQRRYGECQSCHQGIEAGSKVMLGTGYFHEQIIKRRYHYDCWIKEVQERSADWFFANKYEPKKMSKEKAAELNRLRARRYYIQIKGGEPNVIAEKLIEVERQIAMVRSYQK